MNIQRDVLEKLLEDAKTISHSAYAPYSKYRVGCAVLTEKGVFCGCNIENASSPLGTCAERAALTNAKIHGAENVLAIAVWCLDATTTESGEVINSETMPCGSCRQWFVEMAPKAVVVTNGSPRIYTVAELLPFPFHMPQPQPTREKF